MDGIIIIDKEKGFTSHDVVAKMRGMLHQKRIGHTGTLDPLATGVLPVLLGRATKLSELLTADSKTYETELLLGITTDTLDVSGNVLTENEAPTDVAAVREAALSFVGSYDQIPPMYSAIKVGGKKLYELARAGKETERPARHVTIEDIEILEINLPTVRFRVSCSKGTYIRSLCDDIGKRLGCGAAMKELRRVRSGSFDEGRAVTLGELQRLIDEGREADAVLSIGEALSDYPVFVVDAAHEKALRNGNELRTSWGRGSISERGVLVCSETGELVGIYRESKKGFLKPYKMLTGND